GGRLHEPGPRRLAAGVHQRPGWQRCVLVQRFAVRQLSRPLLPLPLAVGALTKITSMNETTNLPSVSAWNSNSPAPVVIGGQNTVTNAITGPQQFYRLRQ